MLEVYNQGLSLLRQNLTRVCTVTQNGGQLIGGFLHELWQGKNKQNGNYYD